MSHPVCQVYCCPYKNTGGGGVAAKLRALLRFCGKSITFKRLQPLCPLSPTSILCFQQLRASFCKTPGWGLPQHLRSELRSPVTCATWRLYPLCRQSIAHTSRHHGGRVYPPRVSDFSAVAPDPIASPFVFIFLRIAASATLFFHNHPHCPGVGGADEF